MSISWPAGVTTQEDMDNYARTLFGNCTIVHLLTGTPVDGHPGCFLIRVKGACNNGEWNIWLDLIDKATEATVPTYGRDDVIHVKSRASGALRARKYDTLPVISNFCTSRVHFGGGKHHSLQTGSSATTATQSMVKMLMAKFQPTTKRWHENQPGYHAKAFHLVLNRYKRNDIIEPHQDRSMTYDGPKFKRPRLHFDDPKFKQTWGV